MKNNEERVALDIALATEAHAMFARLLKEDDLSKIRSMARPDELIAFLRHTEGWGRAVRDIPPEETGEAEFSLRLEHELYQEYEWLYRFAQKSAKDFLIIFALQVKGRAIISSLRRLTAPESPVFQDPLPPFFRNAKGYDIRPIQNAATFDEVVRAGGSGVFGDTLRAMKLDPETGLPDFSEAAAALDARLYSRLDEFLRDEYKGPDKKGLTQAVSFRVDARNARFLLRLRRWNTSPEKALDLLEPLRGQLTLKIGESILGAPSDEDALRIIGTVLGVHKVEVSEGTDPEKFISSIESTHFRKIIHGEPTLSTAYAFLVLKEMECDMLKRAYVALQYGVSPAAYM